MNIHRLITLSVVLAVGLSARFGRKPGPLPARSSSTRRFQKRILSFSRRDAMAGHKDRAQELLDRLYAGHESGLIVPYRVAAVYVALGDEPKAISRGSGVQEIDAQIAIELRPEANPSCRVATAASKCKVSAAVSLDARPAGGRAAKQQCANT